VIDDIVNVPSVIKNKKILNSYIINKFKDTLPTKDILLNFSKIDEDKEQKQVQYKVDAVAKKEFSKKLKYLPDLKEIKSATINKFALLNISRHCYTPKENLGYFAIYTFGKTLSVLAIDGNNDLLFERTSTLTNQTNTIHNINITEELNQTIAYVKQQFRNVSFSTMLIGGSLALDDEALEHLLFATNMAIAVMYPNSFIKGLSAEEPQHYLLTLGSLFVKKQEQFLTDEVFALKEFALLSSTFLAISGLIFAISLYMSYTSFVAYDTILQKYNNIKISLLKQMERTDTYPLDELEKSYQHLLVAEKFLHYHPSDILIKFQPLVELVQPKEFTFHSLDENEPTFSILFEKEFDSLTNLYHFEQQFKHRFEILNSDNKLLYDVRTNYTAMKFNVKITNHQISNKTKPQTRRRRR
jgi:hypothetical protein